MSTQAPTPFELIGGAPGVRRLVDRFYDLMDTEPAAAGIRAFHPPSLEASRDKLYRFLTGWMGGPPLYVQHHGPPMLRARHLPFPIGEPEAEAWVGCMDRAIADQEMPEELRDFLRQRFRAVAGHMRNRFPEADGTEGAAP